ncbi:protein AGENET DOMAIN (AGD)-CONTAINING P1-like [Solanum dulcamara]|uniref:protein AGENET DOMAIN (AGD)-CONTAINING P1-like n=1 Tax=Solanum dulcamara TaxID=45834 RepID=UPI0024862656|nr:protein AGENET DOMAIN (AGD)-CONTAINING P1-like [Solanum dulcamara]
MPSQFLHQQASGAVAKVSATKAARRSLKRPGAYHYGVKYKTLLTNDEASPLEEIVTVSEVRHVLPDQQTETMFVKNDFRLYDMVDMFANDGWWFWLITGKIGQKYYVYFPTNGDNIEYPSDVLRFHQEWSHGEWIYLLRTREDF